MSESDVLYEDEAFNGIDVQAATIEKLVDYCLEQFDEKNDDKTPGSFVEVFFLTYHWYIETDELLRRFIDLYNKRIENEETKYIVGVKIIRAIKYWLDHYGNDFEGNDVALSMLNVLNTKVKDVNGFSLTLNLDDWRVSKRSNKIRIESDKQRESLNFNDMPGDDIADQLLFLSWKSLKKIPVFEWMRYGKTAKTSETPTLKEQIGLFNDISKYVMAMILNRLNPENRAKAIHKFIVLAKRLLHLNDFNTLLAVVGGLVHSSITRLNKTKDYLSKEDKLFLENTQQLLSSEKNYTLYRNKADNTDGFLVPILGVTMKDLVALETAVPDFIEHNGKKLVNFHKMVQVSGIVEHILRSRHIQPNVLPKKEIFNVMRVSLRSRYTEDDLYSMSLDREPRTSTGSVKTPKPKESLVFADWAQGLTQGAPPRDTVEKHVKHMVDAVFKTYDLDHNGSINKAEFDALASNFPLIDKFAILDIDCDGNISRQEMTNYFMNANSQEMSKEFLHDFQENSFYSPQNCVYCTGFLWGIGKSGYKCKVCQISCHKDCKDHVVKECRPTRSYSVRTLDRPKGLRKRLKYVDQEWHGSTDSQLYASDTDSACASPQIHHRTSVSNGDVFNSSIDGCDSYVGRLKEKILRLEMEKDSLKKENSTLKSKLSTTEGQVISLQSHLGLVRQQSVKFMMEQMERLNTCKETDV